MKSLTADQEQATAAAIREISHIATLPEVTVKIIELVEDPTSTAQDLHQVIANDPALCSRILKVVNSSFYGLPGQIGSINRAIVLLGLNAVKNIAISASLAKIFRGGDLCASFSARHLWKHSIATAASAKLLADDLGLGLPDEAFLAGLIHDIGVMVEMQYDRDKLIEVVESLDTADGAPGADMRRRETEVFGADHEQFGHALCQRWKFPSVFATVTGSHHEPLDAPEESRTLPCIVYVADRIAASVDEGYRLDLPDLSLDPGVLDLLKIREDQVEAIRGRVIETYEETSAMLA
jgi:putative nucleotidyltransferase with HDIG domain